MPPTILVVDDEPAIRDLVSGLLEDEGYTVRSAPDGLAAVEAVEQDMPNLILTDLYMPGLDGLGLIAQLRHKWSRLPIVVLSAAIRISPPAGVPFVAKPLDVETLLAVIAGIMNGQHD
jgi:two-component system nitrogen regulation response regulator NtrX